MAKKALKVRDVDLSRYKNKEVSDPKGEKTKIRWLNYYQEYTQNNLTISEISKKYGADYTRVQQGIKWAALKEGGFEKSVYKGAMETRLIHTLKSLDDTLERSKYSFKPRKLLKYLRILERKFGEIDTVNKEAEDAFVACSHLIYRIVRYVEINVGQDIKDELAVRAEIRQTVKMLSQIEKILGAEGKGESSQPTQLNIVIPNINRGQGVEAVQPMTDEDKEVFIATG